MDAFSLTARQRQRLEQLLHQTCDARVYRRVLAILEVSRGIPVEDVAIALGVTRQSVYNWLRRYDSKDCEASLRNRPQSGRPRLLPEERQSWLRDLMRIRPEARGYSANEWTVPLLQEELLHCTGRYMSADTIGRSLARLGFVWKRPRYVLSPDPDRLKKTPYFQGNRANVSPECAAC
jgi:transposase